MISERDALRMARRATQSWTGRRWLNALADEPMSPTERRILGAILITEISARPAWFRAGEWLVWWILSHTPSHSASTRASRMTLGPLQLPHAPWDRQAAVSAARQHLGRGPAHAADLGGVAALWNGRISTGAPDPNYVLMLRAALTEVDRYSRATLRTSP